MLIKKISIINPIVKQSTDLDMEIILTHHYSKRVSAKKGDNGYSIEKFSDIERCFINPLGNILITSTGDWQLFI